MKVAVIGAGTMGRGIAQAFAQCADVEKVYLCDIKQEFADGGKAKVKASLDKRVAKGKMTQEAEDAILNKMQTGLNSQAVDPDLVVEAALEVMDIKKSTFKDLEENIVKNDKCIFATNTSSLSVTEIGAGLKKPVIGMHFFNPAPVMKLVEVIKGANTSDEDVKAVKEIAVKLGKTPVEVNEAPGFVVNRILIPMINEGIQVYSEGVSNEAWLQPSDGTAGTGRLHWSGYRSCHHGYTVQRDRRFQVPSGYAVKKDGQRRTSGCQDWHWLLQVQCGQNQDTGRRVIRSVANFSAGRI